MTSRRYLKADEIAAIRRAHSTGHRIVDLAAAYDAHTTVISRIVARHTLPSPRRPNHCPTQTPWTRDGRGERRSSEMMHSRKRGNSRSRRARLEGARGARERPDARTARYRGGGASPEALAS